MTIPTEAPVPTGPFMLTPRQIATHGGHELSEVLLAIETGELRTIGGTETLVQARHAREWSLARHAEREPDAETPPAPAVQAPTVNPLTGKVHHELTVDPVTGDRLE